LRGCSARKSDEEAAEFSMGPTGPLVGGGLLLRRAAPFLTAIIASLTCSLSARTAVADQKQQGQTGDAVATVISSGGLCPYGPCYAQVVIGATGAYKWTEGLAGGRSVRGRGRLSSRDVADLLTQVNATDFEAVKALKFNGTCPTAYDGQEVTYVIRTMGGKEEIPSCKYAVDDHHPLFRNINRLVGKIYASSIKRGRRSPPPKVIAIQR
jgi:hypothetical protein